MSHDFATYEARKVALDHAVDVAKQIFAAPDTIVDNARKFEAFLLGDITVDIDVSVAQSMRKALLELKRQLGTDLGLS